MMLLLLMMMMTTVHGGVDSCTSSERQRGRYDADRWHCSGGRSHRWQCHAARSNATVFHSINIARRAVVVKLTCNRCVVNVTMRYMRRRD